MPDKLAALVVSLLLLAGGWGAAAAGESPQAPWLSRLAELGRLIVVQSESSATDPSPTRTRIEQDLDALCRESRGPIRKTIDQALREGSREERLGALELHHRLISSTGDAFPREPLNGAYPALFYRLIQEDDRTLPVYTEALAEGFAYYPRSRLTALAYMYIAGHTADPATREKYVRLTADALSIDLTLDDSLPVLWKERRLEGFEA